MANSLSRRLEFERQINSLQGISIVQGTKKLNHSQVVDDTLLLSGAFVVIAERFKAILDIFINASGGCVNKHKSCIDG